MEAQDFRKTVDEARRGDFIYFDPPYLPISAYSDFKRYTLEQFREADQVELARVFRELDAKGCRVVLSNSEHPRTRELYAGLPMPSGLCSDGAGILRRILYEDFFGSDL